MLVLMLEMHGHKSHVVPTGEAALEYLCPVPTTPAAHTSPGDPPAPGLLLLDLHLADMDGITLVERLKGSGCTLPPIIVLSARGKGVVAEAASILGAADYFVKPADMDDLMSSVARVLS